MIVGGLATCISYSVKAASSPVNTHGPYCHLGQNRDLTNTQSCKSLHQRRLVCVYIAGRAMAQKQNPNPNFGLREQKVWYSQQGPWFSGSSQKHTLPLPGLLHLDPLLIRVHFITLLLNLDCLVDGHIKDILDASRFFRAALDVCRAHLFRDCRSLFWCHRGETLRAQEFDASSFGAKVGFQAHEDERCCRAEVKDFRVPL